MKRGLPAEAESDAIERVEKRTLLLRSRVEKYTRKHDVEIDLLTESKALLDWLKLEFSEAGKKFMGLRIIIHN